MSSDYERKIDYAIEQIKRLPVDRQKDELIKLRDAIIRDCTGDEQQKLVLKLRQHM